MKLFVKVDDKLLVELFKNYSKLDMELPKKVTVNCQIKVLMENFKKERSLFEMKNKIIRVSEKDLWEYLKQISPKNKIILKSALSFYLEDLIFLGFTRIKYLDKIYYLSK